jgi:hypothetical protein
VQLIPTQDIGGKCCGILAVKSRRVNPRRTRAGHAWLAPLSGAALIGVTPQPVRKGPTATRRRP